MKISLIFLYGLILIVVLFTFTVGGCTSLSTVTGKSTTSTPGGSGLREDATQSPLLNSSGNQAQSINTPDYTGMAPSPPIANQFVELAKQDLAERMKINADEIHLLKVTDINWQDITQGCSPTPGQTLNKGKLSGYRVWLEVHGKDYVYHIGLDGKTFLCPS